MFFKIPNRFPGDVFLITVLYNSASRVPSLQAVWIVAVFYHYVAATAVFAVFDMSYVPRFYFRRMRKLPWLSFARCNRLFER